MSGISRKIRCYLQDKLGITGLKQEHERQLAFQNALLNFVSPEVLPVDASLQKFLRDDLNARHQITEFKTAIHKNDLMFQHHLYHHPDAQEALKHYFRVGASVAEGISKLMALGDASLSFLDFGSGYGRVSRFLPHYFPQADIWTSEVKEGCVNFHQSELGMQAFLHQTDAESFPDRQFDVIFALSVFTHLPQTHFESWLKRLVQALNPGGKLIISFNNVTKLSQPTDFHYSDQSEDSFFATPDRLEDATDYGLTHVSEGYLKALSQDLNLSLNIHTPTYLGRQQLAVLG